jgi:hypothetical protein
MESKTSSKADQLKGLAELRNNPFQQMVFEAAEHEVQQCLNLLLSPGFVTSQDDAVKAVSILGEMRGLRGPKTFLDAAISRLTEEVKAESPLPEQPKQESEV